eukprot:jgi/Botrbrau1/16353/Bobra.178_1s0006.1
MDNQEQLQPQTAYGHPSVAFFHVAFKISAIVMYILLGFISSSYVVNFVVVVLLLMADFWVTKNVSGRLLVGLRWWNEVTDEGDNWRFESLEEGQRQINSKDSWVFWWALYLTPFIWIILGIVAIARFKFDYLLVVAVAVLLSASNVLGFTKCSKQATGQVKSVFSAAVTKGLNAAMARV